MDNLKIYNPFNAPVLYEEIVSSTMDVSRIYASNDTQHGTVITANYQKAGRGRGNNRYWEMEKDLNLPFTIFLRYKSFSEIPVSITLRAGLAVSLAIEDFAPCLQNKVMVKWPNDIMIGSKKTAGILCEADGTNVFLGIGINVMQEEFPLHLKGKATSIALESSMKEQPVGFASGSRYDLLELILKRLFDELETDKGNSWKYRLEQRLYKKNSQVTFIDGAADSGREVKGLLAGIGQTGELLIIPDGMEKAQSFVTGELLIVN